VHGRAVTVPAATGGTPVAAASAPTPPPTSPPASSTITAPSSTVASPATPSPSSAGSPSPFPTPHAFIRLPKGVGHFSRAPTPALLASPRDRPVPILMYHVLGSPTAGDPYPELFVSAADFAAQMRYLVAQHYTAVRLDQVVDFWHGRGRLPARPVVLTFDDGYRSDWAVAAPILERIGWPGVLNLCLNSVKNGDLSPRLVTALVRAGWEIDDHSLTHPDMTTLDAAALRRETVVSRRLLQRISGQRVSFFSYPAGRYDDQVIAALKAAGFKAATTEGPGLARPRGDRFTLPRVRVASGMSLSDFAKALRTG